MTELQPVSGTEEQHRLMDVVFLHGLDGDARTTWLRKGASDSWMDWLGRDYPEIGLWSVNYDAWSSRWRGQAMPMQDRAVNLLSLLESSGIGQRPLVFVCHSMGGLLAKQLAFHSLAISTVPTPVGTATKAIIFLATPHTGSSIAKFAQALRAVYRPTVAVRDLEDNHAYLRMLNEWYRGHADSLRISNLVFFETRKMHGVFVVDQASSNPGLSNVTPIPVDADHVGICKLTDRNDLVYLQVVAFLNGLLSGLGNDLGIVPSAQSDSDASSLKGRVAQALATAGIFDSAHSWLLRDQIIDTGGWGTAQAVLLESLTGQPLAPLEIREGGIVSTFVALKALRDYEGDLDVFRSKDYAWSAVRYLLQRQSQDGGFGRFVHSRSGIELLPSVRHTAFAVSALLDLDASSTAVAGGIEYLKGRIAARPAKWWRMDAAPSLALAGVLHLDDCLAQLGEGYLDIVGKASLLSELTARSARTSVAEQAATTEYAPFWPPYGGQPEMVFDTALTTIDLLPKPLPERLRTPVVRVLTKILEYEVNGGIPYGPSDREPDVGMSAFMLYLLIARGVEEPGLVNSDRIAGQFEEAIHRITEYLTENWSNRAHRDKAYADTLAYVLRLMR